jgi:lysophospholipase L1-like esterase
MGKTIASFDEDNPYLINRNKAVENFTNANRIPLIDLYSLSVSHTEYLENDGIHFNEEGAEDEVRHVSDEIIKIIENSDFAKKYNLSNFLI